MDAVPCREGNLHVWRGKLQAGAGWAKDATGDCKLPVRRVFECLSACVFECVRCSRWWRPQSSSRDPGSAWMVLNGTIETVSDRPYYRSVGMPSFRWVGKFQGVPAVHMAQKIRRSHVGLLGCAVSPKALTFHSARWICE
ncbi:hypothetical protein GGTG_02837 [Gaeumannomyces tritici R3-111a-1]|uniref:Uncharacterized protein n=1 Tax=Gaeumannomyces tritici (strain R3-111a-1) TaxID=644352 RepID=J3NNI1_GAET3|nr:hypothetical protein GGTG_02837 [Gaeumannomyces tritici R3-111a-1]EJT77732.1 hypothetical protein GGTG_02837 [Gaeumannomyces tritici R3-111a-1]